MSESKPANNKVESNLKSEDNSPTPRPDNKVTKASAATPTQVSKTAIVALLIGLIATAGVGGVYYWHVKEQQALEQKILQQSQLALTENNNKIQQLLKQQQKENVTATTQALSNFKTESQAKIDYLEGVIARLEQNQPSDWLVHEAEYLIRVAGRTIWLERDTSAAIALLKDAEQRIQELNNPSFLDVRKAIHQDIAKLNLMPTLNTEAVVLSLLGLEQQVSALPLDSVHIPTSSEQEPNFELSESANDWRENLNKTWQKFLADFITVRRRTANVEPLMAPRYQQNLRQNLQLKLQLAQWAASKEHKDLYLATLADIKSWLNEYFDMAESSNQNFIKNIQELESQLITFNYATELTSLTAIRHVLAGQKNTIIDNSAVSPEPTQKQEEKPAQEPSTSEGSI